MDQKHYHVIIPLSVAVNAISYPSKIDWLIKGLCERNFFIKTITMIVIDLFLFKWSSRQEMHISYLMTHQLTILSSSDL